MEQLKNLVAICLPSPVWNRHDNGGFLSLEVE